jgi:hypothetical protein
VRTAFKEYKAQLLIMSEGSSASPPKNTVGTPAAVVKEDAEKTAKETVAKAAATPAPLRATAVSPEVLSTPTASPVAAVTASENIDAVA